MVFGYKDYLVMETTMIGKLYSESVYLSLLRNGGRFCIFPSSDISDVDSGEGITTTRVRLFDSSEKNELIYEIGKKGEWNKVE